MKFINKTLYNDNYYNSHAFLNRVILLGIWCFLLLLYFEKVKNLEDFVFQFVMMIFLLILLFRELVNAIHWLFIEKEERL